MFKSSCLVLTVLGLVWAVPAWSQVPSKLSGHLLFKLGGADAGHESYSVERTGDGYRLTADVDLQVVGMHIVQHLEVEAGQGLASGALPFSPA